ncbi:MAG: hypothetical protein ILP11_01695 [Alphaproteobacteria bacterium]|nr:hypothetical protein [Alphaproteobacteria bacterium]
MSDNLEKIGENLGARRNTLCKEVPNVIKQIASFKESSAGQMTQALDERSKTAQPSPQEQINENAAPTPTTQNRTHT